MKTQTHTILEEGVYADLHLDPFIEIEGSINAQGILLADKIEFEQNEALSKIETTIDSINVQEKTLVVFGKTIHVDHSTLLWDENPLNKQPLQFEQLLIGDTVDIKLKIQADGRFLAKRLSREAAESQASFQGFAKNINTIEQRFVLLGIDMLSNVNTQYINADEEIISADDFFNRLQQNSTFIELKGEKIHDNMLLMQSVKLVNF